MQEFSQLPLFLRDPQPRCVRAAESVKDRSRDIYGIIINILYVTYQAGGEVTLVELGIQRSSNQRVPNKWSCCTIFIRVSVSIDKILNLLC